MSAARRVLLLLGDVPRDPRIRSFDDLVGLVLEQLDEPADLVAQARPRQRSDAAPLAGSSDHHQTRDHAGAAARQWRTIARRPPRYNRSMEIFRVYSGSDGQSHFDDLDPRFESSGDQSERAELTPGSGILVRRFEPNRTNSWHHAPGRYAVFTLCLARGGQDRQRGAVTAER